MRVLDLRREGAAPITSYGAAGAASVTAARGEGAAHVYTLHFEAGGRIGRHPAGPAQLFLVVEGAGWVEGGDGVRTPLGAGFAALFEPGELHAKGSDTGMTAVMVQVERLEGVAPEALPRREGGW